VECRSYFLPVPIWKKGKNSENYICKSANESNLNYYNYGFCLAIWAQSVAGYYFRRKYNTESN